MKKLLIICSLLFSTIFCNGQSLTTVTATLQDSSGQIWSGANWRAELIPPFGNPNVPNNQGHPVMGPQTGFANNTGTFTVVLDNNLVITPTGTTWRFTLCPNATVSACSVSTQVIHGTSQNIGASLSADLTVPTVSGNPSVYRAYADSQVTGGQGSIYWNVTDNTLRGFDGTNWDTIGNGGGGGGGNISGTLTNGKVPVAAGAHTLVDSTLSDDGSGLTYQGEGTGSFGGSPGILNIIQTDSNPFALTVSSLTAPAGTFGGIFIGDTGVTGLQGGDSGGIGSSIQVGAGVTAGIALSAANGTRAILTTQSGCPVFTSNSTQCFYVAPVGGTTIQWEFEPNTTPGGHQGGAVWLDETGAAGVQVSATDGQSATKRFIYWPDASGTVLLDPGTTYYQTPGNGAAGIAAVANKLICGGVIIPPGGVKVGHMAVNVTVADVANLEDFGVYDSTGLIRYRAGAQHVGSTGTLTAAAVSGTAFTLSGKAYVCFTSTGSTFTLSAVQNATTFYAEANTGINTGSGVIPNSITPPTDVISPMATNAFPQIILYP